MGQFCELFKRFAAAFWLTLPLSVGSQNQIGTRKTTHKGARSAGYASKAAGELQRLLIHRAGHCGFAERKTIRDQGRSEPAFPADQGG